MAVLPVADVFGRVVGGEEPMSTEVWGRLPVAPMGPTESSRRGADCFRDSESTSKACDMRVPSVSWPPC